MDLLIILGAFVAGIVVGFILLKVTSGDNDAQALRKKLEELQAEHQGYQSSVNEHFTRTADLIETMNKNYSEIQSHLMQGAELLVSSEYRLESEQMTQLNPDADDNLEVPKDWAPKKADQKGTLSEGFGLNPETEEAETTQDSSQVRS
ncbi:YhcB family protein [Gynuella sp.]|uniref:YhcB family protein n=1 Tax=Gynuella sp. TaxID=2969146 RepID=UPI003D0EA915